MNRTVYIFFSLAFLTLTLAGIVGSFGIWINGRFTSDSPYLTLCVLGGTGGYFILAMVNEICTAIRDATNKK